MALTLVPDNIDEYATTHSEPSSPLLVELRRDTFEHVPKPQMQVGPLEGALLRMLVKLSGARRVLEVGTYTGYSALIMAEGLPDDGELITCDKDPVAAQMAERYFARSPHGKKIKVKLGLAQQTIETLEGMFDLVFLDADKEGYQRYYETVLPKVRRGGLIVADNTLWSGRVLDPKEASDHALVAFNDFIARDERVEKVLLTVRDGMTLMLKR